MEDREIKKRARDAPHIDDMDAGLEEPLAERPMKTIGAQAAITSKSDPLIAAAPMKGAKRAPEIEREFIAEIALGMTSDIVFAEDIGIHRGLFFGARLEARVAASFERLDDGAYILRAIPREDEQGVVRIDDHHIVHAYDREHLILLSDGITAR